MTHTFTRKVQLLQALVGLEDAEMLLRQAARDARERDPDAEVVLDAKLAIYGLLEREDTAPLLGIPA